MKHLSLAIIAGFFAFTACGPGQQRDEQAGTEDTAMADPAAVDTQPDTIAEEPVADINTLKEMAGKKITVDSLTKIEEVNNRLKRTLRADYDLFKELSEAGGQAGMEGDLFYVFFTQEPGQTDPGTAFMVDYKTNEVFTGIKNGQDIRAAAEKGSNVPKLMEDWAMGKR